MATSADQPQPAAAGTANLPAVLDDIAPPPLIRDDTAAPYAALLAHIIAEVKPHGIVEHIWVRDFVDLAFEVVRLRGLKADLMTASAGEGLRNVLRDLGADDYFDLASDGMRASRTLSRRSRRRSPPQASVLASCGRRRSPPASARSRRSIA